MHRPQRNATCIMRRLVKKERGLQFGKHYPKNIVILRFTIFICMVSHLINNFKETFFLYKESRGGLNFLSCTYVQFIKYKFVVFQIQSYYQNLIYFQLKISETQIVR